MKLRTARKILRKRSDALSDQQKFDAIRLCLMHNKGNYRDIGRSIDGAMRALAAAQNRRYGKHQ